MGAGSLTANHVAQAALPRAADGPEALAYFSANVGTKDAHDPRRIAGIQAWAEWIAGAEAESPGVV